MLTRFISLVSIRSYSGWPWVLLIVSFPFWLDSCGFCGPQVGGELCWLSEAPLTKSTTAADQRTVFEVPGTLIVFHGSACAKSVKSGTKDVIKLDQSIALPAYVTNATVLLNGWEVEYLKGDHHVAGLATMIDTIRIEQGTLKWQAAGVLSDDNFDDAYGWCYHFTVIAWNATAINLQVDHTDMSCSRPNAIVGNIYSASNKNTTTALSTYASFIQNPIFANSETVAILPRGFGFSWSGCDEDHHILQMAYHLGHSEVFVEAGKSYYKVLKTIVPVASSAASQVGNGFVSWESSAIFKDNDDRRDYNFGELVTALSGSDLGVIEPPYAILPFNGADLNVIPGSPDVKTEAFIINDIPYQNAVPILTGGDLQYITDDQHVLKTGVWIDNFRYDIAPGALTGTLSYTLASSLHDDDRSPDFDVTHTVKVLGFQAITAKENSERVPDLIPFSPSGTTPNAFCRIESGQKLRVTIRNQGNMQAGVSKTTVIFSNHRPITLDTPAIPAGGSVDLIFPVPANCFSPDCSFKITVDSTNQVNESTHESNNSVSGGCLG